MKNCEFYTVFERGRLESEYVSFAKRPTKISLNEKSFDFELSRNNLHGTWQVKKTDRNVVDENGDFCLFKNNEFYHIWNGEIIGPKEFTLTNAGVYFSNDTIHITSFDGHTIKAQWERPDYSENIPACELEKISNHVEIRQNNYTNFTFVR